MAEPWRKKITGTSSKRRSVAKAAASAAVRWVKDARCTHGASFSLTVLAPKFLAAAALSAQGGFTAALLPDPPPP